MDDQPTNADFMTAGMPVELANHAGYRLIRELGRGGMGRVILAHNRLMGRDEVLKIIDPDFIEQPGVRDRFLAEIRAVARLRHVNIVTAYSAFRAGESLVFAMEYADGLDLARMVRARGSMPIPHASSFIHQAALGLRHAHRAGLVHRDIKPSNLMLTRKGGRAIIKVLDFGLAKMRRERDALSSTGTVPERQDAAVNGHLTLAGQLLGTPDFIAPEQIGNARGADIRSDIYSLGCTFYYLLSGRPPFLGATDQELLEARYSTDATPLNLLRPDIPTALASLVARMMAKNPADRFQSPDEVSKALIPYFKSRPAVRGNDSAEDDPADLPVLASGSTRFDETFLPPTGSRAATDVEIWSSLIDVSELGNDSVDESRQTQRSTTGAGWAQHTRASAIGLVAALLLVGVILGFREFESRWNTRDPGSDVAIAAARSASGPLPATKAHQTTEQAGAKAAVAAVTVDRAKAALSLKPDRSSPRLAPKDSKSRNEMSKTQSQPAGTRSTPVRKLAARDSKSSRQCLEVARVQTSGRALHARFLPGKERVVYETVGNDAGVWIGDLDDLDHPRKLAGSGSLWLQVALASDGRSAVALDKDAALSVWDVETGKSHLLKARNRAAITTMAITPDGQHVLYASENAIHVRDLESGRDKEQRGRFESAVLQVAFCPTDARRIVTSHANHTIRMYNLETRRQTAPIQLPADVTDLAVLPDGERVLVSSSDGTVSIWDLAKGRKLREICVAAYGRFGDKPRQELIAPGGVVTVSLSPDGRRALFGSGQLMALWDLETDEELDRAQHPAAVTHVRFSSDGTYAVSCAGDVVRVWDLPPGRKPGERPPLVEIAQYFGEGDTVNECTLVTPDGRHIVTCGWPQTVLVFDWDTGDHVRLDKMGGRAMAIAPDGRRALIGDERVLKLRDLESGNVLQTFEGHTDLIFCVAFSPDGRVGYSTSGGKESFVDGLDADIRIWDLAETGREVGRLSGHNGIVRTMAVSADGRRVLSGGESDKTVILWDALTQRVLHRMTGHTGGVGGVAFLPDGLRAVSGGRDKTVRIWDLETGQEIQRYQGEGEVETMALAPGGRWLLTSAFWGRALQLWDLEAREPNTLLSFAGVPPRRGAFTPDGRHAVWLGEDGIVRVYQCAIPDPPKVPPGSAQSKRTAGKAKR